MPENARAMESSGEERARLRALTDGPYGQEMGDSAAEESGEEGGREAV
jgi:hypothetical protein